MTEPGIGLKRVPHVVFQAFALDSFPEVAERVSSPLRQRLLALDLHPEMGTLRLALVLQSNLENLDGFSDGVPHICLAKAEALALLVLVVVGEVPFLVL